MGNRDEGGVGGVKVVVIGEGMKLDLAVLMPEVIAGNWTDSNETSFVFASPGTMLNLAALPEFTGTR